MSNPRWRRTATVKACKDKACLVDVDPFADSTQFLPSNPALLGNNMNHGQRINLRLRPPGAETTFYEYDQLVLVMLHEVSRAVVAILPLAQSATSVWQFP